MYWHSTEANYKNHDCNSGITPSPRISVRCILDADEVSENDPAYFAKQYGLAPVAVA